MIWGFPYPLIEKFIFDTRGTYTMQWISIQGLISPMHLNQRTVEIQ